MSTELENTIESDHAGASRRFPLPHVALLLLVVAAAYGIRTRWFSNASQAAAVSEPAAVKSLPVQTTKPILAEPVTETPATADSTVEPTQPTMFGSWRDNYYGERTMTFDPDGTGVMIIKLDSVGQAIYGEQLLFNLKWENRDGVLVMQFTGGEPKQAVETISKLWGDRHEQKIELLTETELHLRSTDSQNLYKLKHVEE